MPYQLKPFALFLMKNNLKILTSLWFLIGLAILLLNDFIFKELYGNWLTGKLSDFAGLFIFPLFWTALFPKNKNRIFLSTALFFIFWKSPYSEPLLDFWDNYMLIKIARVIDFSDLIALLVLPIAFQYENRKETIKKVQLNPAIPFVLAIFSFMATSLPFNDVEINKEYSFDIPRDTLVERIYHLPMVKEQIENTCTRDSAGTYWIYRMSEQDTIWTEEELLSRFVQDSLTLFVKEDFCSGEYQAGIALSGDAQSSKIKLKYFFHRCRKNEWKKSPLKGGTAEEKLINSFETKIIQALKK